MSYVNGRYDRTDDSYEAQAARHYAGMFNRLITGISPITQEDISKAYDIISGWTEEINLRSHAGEVGSEDFERSSEALREFSKIVKLAQNEGIYTPMLQERQQ